jgi:ADP-heptose:LPS heptosyltransferase
MSDRKATPLLSRFPDVRKVALVRASRIGDFICATPAFRALRKALPGAEIILIGLPFVAPLARRSPWIDRFVPFPGFPGMAEQFFQAREALLSLGRMQAGRFDLAVQMHGTGVYSNTYTLMLGARATAGFVREGDGPGRLDAALPMPGGHETERLLALMGFLGVPSAGTACDFPLLAADRSAAGRLLKDCALPLIGVHLYARKTEKRWPVERFAAAAAEVRMRHGGTVVLLGESGPQSAVQAFTENLGPPVTDLTSRTSVAVLGAVIERLAVLLTNDSGPAHIAYALGVPAVTIFGETDPERWGPPLEGPFRAVVRNLPCRPCEEEGCASDYACLRGVSVERVVEAASDVIRT